MGVREEKMDLENLNKEQKKAVLYNEGPLLILAGAGSGKTKVLTTKIAYLIKEKNISPYEILAITFTNKAAKEIINVVIIFFIFHPFIYFLSFLIFLFSILRLWF